MHITIWNENHHEARGEHPAVLHYPDGIHTAIARGVAPLLGPGDTVATATMDEADQGLSEERLRSTDVLMWWAHMRHHEVDDVVIDRVVRHVQAGMGLIALHSAHISRPFLRLMGSSGALGWRNDGERELVWTVDAEHPIAAGIPNPIVIPEQETYSEPFDIPSPDELVFISSFAGGEVFRSGVTYRRGRGKIFYFSPGDQDYPVYHQPDIHRVLANAARWARPDSARLHLDSHHIDRADRPW